MSIFLDNLASLYPNELCLELSNKNRIQAWPRDSEYSNNAARWRAYVNRLCLDTFETWIKEETGFGVQPSAWLSRNALPSIWEVVNGAPLTIGQTRIVLIPSEAIDTQEFCVPREWIDIPVWAANYYLAVQVNLDEYWFRVWGYTTHHKLKSKGKYDESFRNYSLERKYLIENLNVMLVARELCPNEMAVIASIAKLAQAEVESLLEQLGQPSLYSPRLKVPFERWAALIMNNAWREQLYQRRRNLTKGTDLAPSKTLTNLSQWFQRNFEAGWQPFEELLKPGGANLAFAFRSGQRIRKPAVDQTADISALINLLHIDSDEETRFKVAECLGAVAPGNSEAITALTALLHNSQDDRLRRQAALSLGQIDPNNPKAGVGRGRQIDLGMQVAGHPVALLVALMPEANEEIGILLRVCPTGGEIYLPPNLQLIVLDESGEVFDEAQARRADNWIQLQFTVQPRERFSVKVALGDASYTEDFVS